MRAEDVERLLERTARAVGVAVGPQQRHEAVASCGPIDGENREERQRLTVDGDSIEGRAVTIEAQPAERAK
jgi:hypothetical protein